MKIKNIIIIILTLIFGVVETWGQTEVTTPKVIFKDVLYKRYYDTRNPGDNKKISDLTEPGTGIVTNEIVITASTNTEVIERKFAGNGGEIFYDRFYLDYVVPSYSKAMFIPVFNLSLTRNVAWCEGRIMSYEYGNEENIDHTIYTSSSDKQSNELAAVYAPEKILNGSNAFNVEVTPSKIEIDNRDCNIQKSIKQYYGFASSKKTTILGNYDLTASLTISQTFSVTYFKHITFDANNGNGSMDKQIVEGSATINTNQFSKDNYHFIGWNTKADGTGTSYAADATITANASDKGEVTLFAQWAPNVYLVTFNENHEEGNSFYKEETYDAKYVLPEQPTRTHYDFIGWFDAPENGNQITTDSDVKVTEDNQQTLYAYWTGKKYNTTFNANNGSFEDSSSEKIIAEEYASKYTLPTSLPSHTGYTFIGWYTTADGGEQVTTNTIVEITDNNQILYAHWTANTYQVSFNSNGGDEIPPIDVTYDGTYENLPDATRYGYNFDGWYTEKNGGTKIEKTTKVDITSAITLYARWTRIKYTISFDANYVGGKVIEKEEEYGNKYILPDEPSRKGYTFCGWWTDVSAGTEITSDQTVDVTEDVNLYAHWTANQYDVTYNANGGKVYDQDEKIIKETYDQKYTCPEPTRYGYDFDGWYTAKEGGEKIEKTDEVDITSNMTLYAHWSPKATNFEAYTASGLGGYYFRSFFDSKVAYEMPDKVMAFTAKVDNDYLLLTAIEGNIIPKETPVILRAEESAIVEDGDKNYITLVTSESGKSISAENVLLGTDMASPNDRCYILSHGSKGLGFYKWPTTKTLEAHKAYIEGGSSSAKALIFRFEDEATGINNEIIDSASDESEPVIYNLSGIRISKPQKGINIIKGKKVWVPGDR